LIREKIDKIKCDLLNVLVEYYFRMSLNKLENSVKIPIFDKDVTHMYNKLSGEAKKLNSKIITIFEEKYYNEKQTDYVWNTNLMPIDKKLLPFIDKTLSDFYIASFIQKKNLLKTSRIDENGILFNFITTSCDNKKDIKDGLKCVYNLSRLINKIPFIFNMFCVFYIDELIK
jgi:hypothetical protein